MKDFFICFKNPSEGYGLKEVLEKNGFSAMVFSNTLEMLEVYSARGCRAFFMDFGVMKDHPYHKAITILKEIAPDAPIIVCNDEESLEHEREARSQNIFFYYVRPIPENELIQLAHDASRKGEIRRL